MPSSHLTLCRPLLLLPSIFPSIRVFSNESALHIRWPKYWSFSFNISPTNGHPGLMLQSKGLSKVFSNTTVQKHQFFLLSFLYSPTLTSIRDHYVSIYVYAHTHNFAVHLKLTQHCTSACVCAQFLSCVWLFVSPRIIAHWALLSHGIFQVRILECFAISYSSTFCESHMRSQRDGHN